MGLVFAGADLERTGAALDLQVSLDVTGLGQGDAQVRLAIDHMRALVAHEERRERMVGKERFRHQLIVVPTELQIEPVHHFQMVDIQIAEG